MHRYISTKFIPLFFFTTVFFSNKLSAQAVEHKPLDSLAFFRTKIDSLDNALVILLGQRMKVVTEIGVYKAHHNMPALQQKRFDAISQKNIELGKNVGLSPELITEIMHAIHKESLKKEMPEIQKVND